MVHREPHITNGTCQCDCSECVSDWQPMTFGGARRYCVCPSCNGGDCAAWRLDREHYEMVTGGA